MGKRGVRQNSWAHGIVMGRKAMREMGGCGWARLQEIRDEGRGINDKGMEGKAISQIHSLAVYSSALCRIVRRRSSRQARNGHQVAAIWAGGTAQRRSIGKCQASFTPPRCCARGRARSRISWPHYFPDACALDDLDSDPNEDFLGPTSPAICGAPVTAPLASAAN